MDLSQEWLDCVRVCEDVFLCLPAFAMTWFHQPRKGSSFLLNTTSSCGAGSAPCIRLHEFALMCSLMKREFRIRLMHFFSVFPADLFVAVWLSVPQSLAACPSLVLSHVTGKSSSLSLPRCPALGLWCSDILKIDSCLIMWEHAGLLQRSQGDGMASGLGHRGHVLNKKAQKTKKMQNL